MLDDLLKIRRFFREITGPGQGEKEIEMMEISPGVWVPGRPGGRNVAGELEETADRVLDGLETFRKAAERVKGGE